jgi:hypothetical protein
MKTFAIFLSAMCVFCISVTDMLAQVIVDDANVSKLTDKVYIQLMYTIDKGSFKPIYFIDYGIASKASSEKQKILIDGVEVDGNLSPMMVLNMLYKSGWEYLGDMIYIREPVVDNWYVYTLRRKQKSSEQ